MRKAVLVLTAVVFGVGAPGAIAQDGPERTLFTNVNVWDGFADDLKSGQDVLIEGNKVAKIGRGLSASGATTIDGGGRTLMPGLIDMHTHVMFPRGLPDHENVWDGPASGPRILHR